ncbi:MAG: ABC transporter ATP-binding protein [Coriobacteriia bacterium]|nr:ABC transporter ATP-binding protein [Coriobacteriia bacterium]
MTNAAITTSKLTKRFGDRKAVDAVSLEVPTGAFLSIFGPNGAGKTTLLRILSTAMHATEGSVQVAGFDVREQPDDVRAHIGLISHDPMLYPDLSALENLMVFAQLYGVPNPEQRCLDLLDAVGLKHRRLDVARTFSRGMTQRLSIARALIHDPEVVFLDEPYSGLDPHAVDVFDQLLASQREGRTFVMVSHDLQKGLQLCTHALVMAKGKVVSFQPKDAMDEAAFAEVYRQTVGAGVA